MIAKHVFHVPYMKIDTGAKAEVFAYFPVEDCNGGILIQLRYSFAIFGCRED